VEAANAPPPLATAHLLFVRRGARYDVFAADGAPPPVGAVLVLAGDEERRYVVLKVGRSPFPDDARPCAFVELA
jgi:hypothetical protein